MYQCLRESWPSRVDLPLSLKVVSTSICRLYMIEASSPFRFRLADVFAMTHNRILSKRKPWSQLSKVATDSVIQYKQM